MLIQIMHRLATPAVFKGKVHNVYAGTSQACIKTKQASENQHVSITTWYRYLLQTLINNLGTYSLHPMPQKAELFEAWGNKRWDKIVLLLHEQDSVRRVRLALYSHTKIEILSDTIWCCISVCAHYIYLYILRERERAVPTCFERESILKSSQLITNRNHSCNWIVTENIFFFDNTTRQPPLDNDIWTYYITNAKYHQMNSIV